MVCISCKTEHSENFCPHCGEKAGIKKITLRSIVGNAFSTFTNMDKGFLYNIKMLSIKPKTIATDYLLGRRKEILNPISFLILTVTAYLIVESLFIVQNKSTGAVNLPEVYIAKVAYAAGKYVHSYFKYFWIFSIVPLAIATKLVFRKYNFMEHLTINSFILGQATLLGLISYLATRIDMPVNPLVYLLVLWLVYRIFLIKENKVKTFFKSFGVLVLFILQLCIITAVVGVVMA